MMTAPELENVFALPLVLFLALWIVWLEFALEKARHSADFMAEALHRIASGDARITLQGDRVQISDV